MKELYGIKVPIDVYGDGINVVYGDREKAEIFTNKNKDAKNHNKAVAWCVQTDDGGNYVYLGKNLKEHDSIVHELTHAILNITNKRGIVIDDNEHYQEHIAYLFGYVIGYVLDTKKKEWFVARNIKRFNAKWIKQK